MQAISRISKSAAVAIVLLLALPAAELRAQAQDDIPEVVRTLIQQGDRHRDAGRHQQAIDSYREAIRLDASVPAVYLSLGALYHTRGELEPSLGAFAAGLKVADDDRGLLYNAAVVALRLGRLEQALGYTERGLSTNPRDGELHALHGAVLTRLEHPKEAFVALETAARLDPGDSQILFRLGNLHHQLGRPGDAVDAYRKAIKKDRSMLRAHYNLGAVLFEMDRHEEALAAYRVGLEPIQKAMQAGQQVDAVHARAFLNLGAIYTRQKDPGRALQAYDTALKLDAALSDAHYNRGYIHFELGDYAAAGVAYERSLSLDPELPVAYLHLGQIAQRRGQLEAAVDWLEQGLTRFEASSEAAAGATSAGEDPRLPALEALAGCRLALGHLEGAEKAYRELLERRPDDPETLLALGRLVLQQGHRDEARAFLEAARRLRPEELTILLELAALANAGGEVETEKALYEEVLARAGGRVEMWPVRLKLALVLLRQGAAAEARSHVDELVQQASARKSKKAGAALPLAERQLIATLHAIMLARDGDRDAARRALRKVLAEGGFAPASDNLAVLDAAAGDLEAAATAMLRSYPGRASSIIGPLAQANLGQVLWLSGRGEDAREHLQATAEAFPRWPGPRAALGDLALRARRYRDAVDELTTAAELCRQASGVEAAVLMLTGGEGGRRVFQAVLPAQSSATGGDAGDLCSWVGPSLAHALVAVAVDDLAPALGSGRSTAAVRDLADRALALSPRAAERAAALYVRGTAHLALGSDQAARRDLNEALGGELPTTLRPLAQNNLGVARARLGETDAARTQLAAARAAGRAEAALNLGILLDEHAGEGGEALGYYDEYLRSGGPRRREVEEWVEHLRRIYR